MIKHNKLIQENPEFVLPTLAEVIGINEAIVLQKVHFWLTTKKHNGDYLYDDKHDGSRWIKLRMLDWQENLLTWCSMNTVKRVIKKLLDKKYLIAENINRNKFEHTLSYTINYNHPALIGLEEGGHLTRPYSKKETETPKMSHSVWEDTKKTDAPHSTKMSHSDKPKMGYSDRPKMSQSTRGENSLKYISNKVQKNTIREASASPNLSPEYKELIQKKQERKANKKSQYKQKLVRKEFPLNRDEGLEISLLDNVGLEEVQELMKKYKIRESDVIKAKEDYINWVKGSSYDPKVWGKDMKIYVDKFCSQIANKKKKDKPKDLYEEIKELYGV